ncbi:hypothetical protein A3J90_05070 [candidate division WOR-1 bacterium RIFOXYC2_FULL_37_10]|uniref:PorV/PorQ family protein n=1 Tax=candidate division WOR-1 bacterium RIFOXYB2_FULL_37_13 TaxID=1802579 RepID=A0A1F4SP48_UNCSA|nr:MAG: hypothetical protein A2246_06640 [candidate division WOR-1 bacterium RIFOXYA2_FULL_37_7]OGC22127.1 MAG: hypothetical protein A2310_03960 [candidate division WOR-1 bacterium RIFOXYB2_FULL_37_13]OGC34433.1 MAG: hypothetical protein A3J90_05070 [candidate division WOR-1 bacterium RIFOXYC2_FULL_37_10]
MNNIKGIFLSILFCFLAFSMAYAIDPTDIGVGARPLAMGKAYTAVADDGSAMFINPAGLSTSNSLKIVSMNGNLLSEIPYTMMGISQPMLGGNVAIGYVGLGVAGIQESTLSGITPEVTGNEGSFFNSVINVSYSTGLERVPVLNKLNGGILKNAKVGTSVKFFSQEYTGASSFDNGDSGGVDIDLGLISEINDNMAIGCTVKNLIPGNNMNSDEFPMSTTIGIANKFNKIDLLTAVDLEISEMLLLHLGVEWKPMKFLSIRAGLDQQPSAGEVATNFSTGLGFDIKGFMFDYAYHTYADLSELTTHYFSIGYNLESKK